MNHEWHSVCSSNVETYCPDCLRLFLWFVMSSAFCIFRIFRNTTCNGVFSFVRTSEFKIYSICYLISTNVCSRVPKLAFQVHKKCWQRYAATPHPFAGPRGRRVQRGGESKGGRGGAAISRSTPGGGQPRHATVPGWLEQKGVRRLDYGARGGYISNPKTPGFDGIKAQGFGVGKCSGFPTPEFGEPGVEWWNPYVICSL